MEKRGSLGATLKKSSSHISLLTVRRSRMDISGDIKVEQATRFLAWNWTNDTNQESLFRINVEQFDAKMGFGTAQTKASV